MKNLGFLLCTAILLVSCSSSHNKNAKKDVTDYAKTITEGELKEMLYTYASNDFEGRRTGEPGQKKAIEFIKKHYVENKIPSPIADGDYFQEIPESYFNGKAKASENVVAFIKGSEKPDEVIIEKPKPKSGILSYLPYFALAGIGIFLYSNFSSSSEIYEHFPQNDKQ